MTQEEHIELCSNYGGFCKKEWVGLTEDQIDKLEKEFVGISVPNIYNFVQAIEAKLKDKNNG